jgi:hypothetical protein
MERFGGKGSSTLCLSSSFLVSFAQGSVALSTQLCVAVSAGGCA